MTHRLSLATLGAAAAVALSACGPTEATVVDSNLARFDSCEALRDYTAEVALETVVQSRYGYYGRGGWLEAGADDALDAEAPTNDGAGAEQDGPTDWTNTNVQEEGVDEIDLVKTDGEHLYIAQDKSLHILDSWPPETAEKRSTVELDGWTNGLFLQGDKVVVFQSVGWDDGWSGRYYSGTRLSVIDVSDRSNPVVEREIDLEGYLADGRMIDGDVYLVVNHYVELPSEVWDLAWRDDLRLPEPNYSLPDAALRSQLESLSARAKVVLRDEVHAAIDAMPLSDILPMYTDAAPGEDVEPQLLHDCTDVYRPGPVGRQGMMSIVNLDLDDDSLAATGLLSDGWTLYASKDNLYVAQSSGWWWWGWGTPSLETHVHKFELSADAEPRYAATGVVPGFVYDQFALSEYDGHLRMTTTDNDWWWGGLGDADGQGANNVFVLEDDGAGELDIVGEVRGIAPGERIYATRMIGERGYMVTFRQVDPFFTLDLSDPTDPRVVGELKIPGFSSYLHPMDKDHLLAVGQDGTWEGQVTGVKVSVYDVSDFANPIEEHKYTLDFGDNDWSWSEALWDHHAFTFHRDTLTIPLYQANWDGNRSEWFSGSVSFSVDVDEGIDEIGRVDHRDLVVKSECKYSRLYDWGDYDYCGYEDYWYAQVRRSVYIEDNLYTISDYGVKINELEDPSQPINEVLFYPAF